MCVAGTGHLLNCYSVLRILIKINPRVFLPFPRHTPQNVSFHVFPSSRMASPVAFNFAARSGCVLNFLFRHTVIAEIFMVSQSSRSFTFRPARLACPGVANSAILFLSAVSSVLYAWNACSTVG